MQESAEAGHSDIQSYSAGFRAVGCTEAVDARDNTSSTYTSSNKGVPIYWLNGNKVADDYEDFYDGSWDDETSPKNESGNNRRLNQSANHPWTGCTHDGTESITTAGTQALGSAGVVRVGQPNDSNANTGPIRGGISITRVDSHPLYALSEVFEVPGNVGPEIANPIPDQDATAGREFRYTFPSRTFSDAEGDALSYTATRVDGTALPGWLTFTPSTRTFQGTPAATDAGTLTVKVTASDGEDEVSDEFEIVVAATDVCHRTPAVRDGIVALVPGISDCGNLTPSHLQNITGTLDLQSLGLSTLRAGDFDGLTGLTGLLLNGNAFTWLPTDVFKEVRSLDTLDLTGSPGAPFKPRVNAGSDRRVFPNETVTLAGTVVGPWGDNVTWQWTQVDGPSSDTAVVDGVILSGADTATASFTAPAPDTTVHFRLIATPVPGEDTSKGIAASDPDWISIAIRGPNSETRPWVKPIPDQEATVGSEFHYPIPPNSFWDPDGDVLTYTATKGDDTPLPAWLSFDDATRTFSGTPASTDAGPLSVKVTADDGVKSSSDTFEILVLQIVVKNGGDLVKDCELAVGHGFSRDDMRIAQGFTTGSHANGYEMSELVIYSAGYTSSSEVKVAVHEANGADPGAEIFALSRTTLMREDHPVTFMPPGNAPRLEADTSYFIVLNETAGGSSYSCWYRVERGATVEGLAGWTMADSARVKDGTNDWEEQDQGSSLWMILQGRELADSDAALSNLTVTDQDGDPITLTPAFSTQRRQYTASVTNTVTGISIVPERSNEGATVTYRDETGRIADEDDIEEGLQMAVAEGMSTINVKVTAEDRTTTQTYTVVVRRPTLGLSELALSDPDDNPLTFAPTFAVTQEDYRAAVPHGVDELTIEAAANNADAQVRYRRQVGGTGTNIPDADGITDGHQVPLETGENVIEITVKVGTRTKAYRLTLNRAGANDSLTAALVAVPSGNNPNSPAHWHFDLLLSESVWKSKDRMRDHVFEVTNGRIVSAERLTSEVATVDGADRFVSAHWRMKVEPVKALSVTRIAMTANRPCTDQGSLCVRADPDDSASQDKLLSNAPELELGPWGSAAPTVQGLKLVVVDTNQAENQGRLSVGVLLRDDNNHLVTPPAGQGLRLRMRTIAEEGAGKATEGEDYLPADEDVLIPGGQGGLNVSLVTMIPDTVDDEDEELTVELSEAWTIDANGLRVQQLEFERWKDNGGDVLATGNTVRTVITIRAPSTQSVAGNGTIELKGDPGEDPKYGFATFTVTRSGNESKPVCYLFETVAETGAGTATANIDYHPITRPVWMDSGVTKWTHNVHAKRDDEDDDNETVKVRISHARFCDDPSKGVVITNATSTWTIDEPDEPTVRFQAPPRHDGKTRFAAQLVTSDPVKNTRSDIEERVLKVNGGQMGTVKAGNGLNDLWEFEIDPDGDDDVVITIESKGSCTDPGTLCSNEDEPFPETVTTRVPGPGGTASPAPLTVSFANAPRHHDGETAFTVEIVFSEEPANLGGQGNKDIKNALQITGGTKAKVRAVNGDNAHRIVTIEPDGTGPVTLWFEATTDCEDENALCTTDGGQLEESARVTVKQAPVLWVSDAGTEEGPGATLDFVVSLSRPASNEITVQYRLMEGTTEAGTDYVVPADEDSHVVFAPGETEKTVSITVIDDGVDEGEEEMGLYAESVDTIERVIPHPDRADISSFGIGTIRDPAPPGTAALTAEFANVPEEHDGTSRFDVQVVFSEPPANLRGQGNKDIKKALDITGGKKKRVRAVDGNDARRRFEIEPHGNGPVTLSVPPTTDCTAPRALCSAAGGKLETGVSTTIRVRSRSASATRRSRRLRTQCSPSPSPLTARGTKRSTSTMPPKTTPRRRARTTPPSRGRSRSPPARPRRP